MTEQPRFKKEVTPKSFIRVNGKEHNLKALLELLKEGGIKIKTLSAQDPRHGAENNITKDHIPALWTQLEVEAPYDYVRRVLESSDEFREHADKILGSL